MTAAPTNSLISTGTSRTTLTSQRRCSLIVAAWLFLIPWTFSFEFQSRHPTTTKTTLFLTPRPRAIPLLTTTTTNHSTVILFGVTGGGDGGDLGDVSTSEISDGDGGVSTATMDSGPPPPPVDGDTDVSIKMGHIFQTEEISTVAPPFFTSYVDPTARHHPHANATTIDKTPKSPGRRDVLRYGTVLLCGSVLTVTAVQESERMQRLQKASHMASSPASRRVSLIPKPVLDRTEASSSMPSSSSTAGTPPPKASARPSSSSTKSTTTTTSNLGRLEAVNFTQVKLETNINVTMDCGKAGCIEIDSKNFTKIQKPKVPRWLPSFFAPSPKVIKEISQSELFVAATVAGAVTEIGRTSLLYPLQTVKTRIQIDQHMFLRKPPPLSEQIIALGTNVQKHVREGNLYAGISPTLLVSVPATGIYYGVRDVTKRMLSMTPLSDVWITLSGALVGDVVSLCFRTPADALAVRLQAQNATVGDWLGDSVQRLPIIIATDLPYLLSKIVLNRLFIHGQLSVDQYAEYAILTAIVAAFLTTPFDVVRTRTLLDKELVGILADDDDDDDEEETKMDGIATKGASKGVEADDEVEHDIISDFGKSAKGAGQGVVNTMLQVAREGEGGYANLFAGWLERVLYLGIGRAWLEPVQLVGYVGIRDAVLLEWF